MVDREFTRFENPMDWTNWHKLYGAGLSLAARLRIVREQIRAALNECGKGPIRIISVCAGDGRDVIEALSDHPRRDDVAASLIDNHAPSLERGRTLARDAGLEEQVEFVCADATLAANYQGSIPADLVIVSGVLGHVDEIWIPRLMGSLPMLCKAGGFVLWNRHLVVNRGSDHVRLIQQSLRDSGFEEVHYEATSQTGFAVGRARFRGPTQPFDAGRVLFEFTGLDRLLQLGEEDGASFPSLDRSPEDHLDSGVGESLTACFERQVKLHPHRTALGSGAWQPTYEELNQTINQLAAALLSRGGVMGDRIALLMQHETPLIAAMLAILKAGRIVVVLNPTDPPARLRQVLADAEPAILLTDILHQQLTGQFEGGACEMLLFEEQLAASPPSFHEVPLSAETPAFIIYTSGSTGPPKGVLQSHGNIVHKALRVTRGLELREEERIILLGALSGGQGVNTTFCALLNGATLCPFPIMNIGVIGLADWMVAQRITVFVSAASVFRHFVRTLDNGQRFPGARLVWLASEPATSDDVHSCRKHFADDCALFHTLASSETGVIAQWRITRSGAVREGRLPVGLAAEGIEVLLLDGQGHDVPRGVTGEIAIRSRHLSTGYWRNPPLTAQRFSEIPDSGGIRVFRSGDRGRLTADGLLEFMGRQDTRVNVHGYRVELSEIEEALSRLPAVEKAVAGMRQKPSGDEQIVAYVMLRADHSPSTEALRDALRATLPGHMIPAAFVFLETLPLTPHGKVDREALRQIAPAIPARPPGDAPASATEKLIADIWSDIFEQRPMCRQDDFFDLGGDSLTAAVIAARIYTTLRVQLDLRAFADHPTLAALASAVDALCAAAPCESAPPLVRVTREEPLPLSFHQERIWRYCQMTGNARGYTSARRHLIRGPLDVAVLRESMSCLAGSHEALRTTFAVHEGSPVQVIHPPTPEPLPLIDLAGTTDPEERATQIYDDEVRRPLDLERGPLMRFTLIRLREDEHQLFRICHHIIDDAWSWDVYFRELGIVYEAKLRGGQPPPPKFERLQYADYAVWQRRVLGPETNTYREALLWWKEKMTAPPSPLELPFRRSEPLQNADPEEGNFQQDLDPDVSSRLSEVVREQHTTFFVVRLAAFVALLADECRQPDVVLGTYVTNRTRAEMQDMFGFFSNMVTLRFGYDGGLTFREWIAAVGVLTSEFQARGEIPYEQLCEDLRKLSAVPLEIRAIFQIDVQLDTKDFGGLELTKMIRKRVVMPWGFTLVFYRGDHHELCKATFDASLYDPVGVRNFVSRLVRFLDVASRQPDWPLARLLAESTTEKSFTEKSDGLELVAQAV